MNEYNTSYEYFNESVNQTQYAVITNFTRESIQITPFVHAMSVMNSRKQIATELKARSYIPAFCNKEPPNSILR